MAPSWPTFLRRCKAKERFDLKSTPPTLLAPVAGGWHPFFYLGTFLMGLLCVALVDISNILTDYYSFSSSFSFFSIRTLHPIGIDVRVPMMPIIETLGAYSSSLRMNTANKA